MWKKETTKKAKNYAAVKRKRTCSYDLILGVFQVTRPRLSPGALGVLLHVSLVSVVEVPIAPARELSATCAVVAACLPPQRPGAAGTARSTWTSAAMPFAPPSLPLVCLLWSCPKVGSSVHWVILFSRTNDVMEVSLHGVYPRKEKSNYFKLIIII